MVGIPFENASTKQKLDYLQTFYNHDDNWNTRRTYYIPPEYKPKMTPSRGIAGQETNVLGTVGDLLVANNLLGLADAVRSPRDNELIHLPLGTLHTGSNDTPTCTLPNPTDGTYSNVKPPHADSRHHEDRPVLNTSDKPTKNTNRLTDSDSNPGSDRESPHEQSELTCDEDGDAGGSINDEEDDGCDSDYDYNRDPTKRLSAVEEEKKQANYRDKEAKRVEMRRQGINNLPQLTRRELKQQKAAIDAQIWATNEKRRQEFEQLDAEMLSVGLFRGSEDSLNDVSESAVQLNTHPRKEPTEVELLVRSVNEMGKILHAVVMNQQGPKKLNQTKPRQKHV
jgi:hypothetical protein